MRIAQSVDHAVHDDPDLVVSGQNAAPDEEMMKEVGIIVLELPLHSHLNNSLPRLAGGESRRGAGRRNGHLGGLRKGEARIACTPCIERECRAAAQCSQSDHGFAQASR